MTNEPNDFDDFDTQIQSDELIPDGYEDQDDDCEPDPRDQAPHCGDDRFWSEDPDFVNWEADYYGNDADGDEFADDFPF